MIRVIADTVVDWSALGKVVLYSLIAGVGIPAIYALAVLGAARSTDPHRRDRGGPVGTFYALLAVLGALVCLAAIGYGIYLMANKS
jgi:hypothetical protein